MDTIRKVIGKKIKIFREMRDITQIELARQLGYSSTGTLSQIESGTRGMDVDRMPLLAQILDVPMPLLLSEIDIGETEAKVIIKFLHLLKHKNKNKEMKECFVAVRKCLE